LIYGNNISLLKMDETSKEIGLEAVNIPDSAHTERIMSTIERLTQKVKTGKLLILLVGDAGIEPAASSV
jgi:hypothetical protein